MKAYHVTLSVGVFFTVYPCAVSEHHTRTPVVTHIQAARLSLIVADNALAMEERIQLAAVVSHPAQVHHLLASQRLAQCVAPETSWASSLSISAPPTYDQDSHKHRDKDGHQCPWVYSSSNQRERHAGHSHGTFHLRNIVYHRLRLAYFKMHHWAR